MSPQRRPHGAQRRQRQKLLLTEWLVSQGWRTFLDDKAQAKFADSFKRFADTHCPLRR
jgi:inorganic triphosphatase YgiF